MSKEKMKQKFLDRIEFFYRNFGSEWTLDDFASNDKEKKYLERLLTQLEERGIVSINGEGKSFVILDLPSKYDL